MANAQEIRDQFSKIDLTSSKSIEQYARNLRGLTFRDVLDLDIKPEGYNPKNYGNTAYRGGMGNLIEERFFGYKSNSDERPDFPEAGVELKVTCYNELKRQDKKRGGPEKSAGERLVLTMIPFDRDVEDDFYRSHLWYKNQLILLIYYKRDKSLKKYDQHIDYVRLFRIPPEDLEIIKEDYSKIISLIKAGKADELSEGLTTYLGACTKGECEEKMWVDQYYPTIDENGRSVHRRAKTRAFSLKRQYMDYVLKNYCIDYDYHTADVYEDYSGDSPHPYETDSCANYESEIQKQIDSYIGRIDDSLLEQFNIPKRSKSRWSMLVHRMLGVKSNRAEILTKAGISVRAVRTEENWSIEQSLSLDPFEFKDLERETDWQSSTLYDYLESTRFLFVVFHKEKGAYRLYKSMFWNMPVADLNGPVQECWETTQRTIRKGVKLWKKPYGKTECICNNLPGMADNPIAHVRPHTSKRAYRLSDGTSIGDLKYASELPDGQYMTKQSFWLLNKYIATIVKPADV